MSWTIKPKSFYAEQLKKLEDRAKEGKETSPKVVEKYYKGYLGRNGNVVNPVVGMTEEIRPYRKQTWKLAKPPRETKPCQHCGELMERPLKESTSCWERRQCCSMTCKKLKHEAMQNLSKSNI